MSAQSSLNKKSVTTQGKKKTSVMSTNLIIYPISRVRKKNSQIQFVVCAWAHAPAHHTQGLRKYGWGRGWQVTFLPETWNAAFVGTRSHNLVFKSRSNFMQSDSIFINKNMSPDLEGQHYSLQAFGKDVQHFI